MPGKFSNLLCKSQITDKNGVCGEGYSSKTMGANCTRREDCVSKEDTQEFSDCKCALNPYGDKTCELFKKDQPWQDAITAFMGYYNRTTECHVAKRWHPCGEIRHYNEWRCAEAKAMYHNMLVAKKNISCLNETNTTYIRELPGFGEFAGYCYFSNLGKKFVVAVGILFLVIYLVSEKQ